MKAVSSLALALAIIGGLSVAASAQQPTPTPAPMIGPGMSFGVSGNPGVWQQRIHLQSKTADLARQYLKVEKESEKREIKQKLTDALNEVFDDHMQQQQKELDDLEKQIAELRTVMKKRAAAKATIVDRRIEQLIQDAEGLGWTNPGNVNLHFGGIYNPSDAFYPKARTTGKKEDSKKE